MLYAAFGFALKGGSLDVPVDVSFKFCFVFLAPLETDLATKSMQIQSKRYRSKFSVICIFSSLSRRERDLKLYL